MMKKVSAYLLLVLVLALGACASSAPTGDEKANNAMTKAAQSMERRASQAFAAGEFDSAAAGYDSAALVYESLALVEPQGRARLSQARALADAGRTTQAQQIIASVLQSPTGLSQDLMVTAQGRAAALSMASDLPQAQAYLQSALATCANSCPQLSALLVLRARTELAANTTNTSSAARDSASAALAVAQSANDRANALRARAQANAALGQHAAVLADAQPALVIDQELGAAQRVLQDLLLLQTASAALGDAAGAQRYGALAERAQAAASALRGGTAP
jgi:tetratricopeptide (TPR) repeat protein